jgi:hypothetical protein
VFVRVAASLVPWQIVPGIEPSEPLRNPAVYLRLDRPRIVEDAYRYVDPAREPLVLIPLRRLPITAKAPANKK